eukprot:XP_001705264.1 Hypothetical protein GL50803_6131 [Giardia lamblia ATCC 50803]
MGSGPSKTDKFMSLKRGGIVPKQSKAAAVEMLMHRPNPKDSRWIGIYLAIREAWTIHDDSEKRPNKTRVTSSQLKDACTKGIRMETATNQMQQKIPTATGPYLSIRGATKIVMTNEGRKGTEVSHPIAESVIPL